MSACTIRSVHRPTAAQGHLVVALKLIMFPAGRAAMVGFVAAVIAELSTNQSVWSQLAGKTASNGRLLERGWQFAPLGFGAVVTLLTYASIAPQFQAGEPALHSWLLLADWQHRPLLGHPCGSETAHASTVDATFAAGKPACWQRPTAAAFVTCSGAEVTQLTSASITLSRRRAKHLACQPRLIWRWLWI